MSDDNLVGGSMEDHAEPWVPKAVARDRAGEAILIAHDAPGGWWTVSVAGLEVAHFPTERACEDYVRSAHLWLVAWLQTFVCPGCHRSERKETTAPEPVAIPAGDDEALVERMATIHPLVDAFKDRERRSARAVLALLRSEGWRPPEPKPTPWVPKVGDRVRVVGGDLAGRTGRIAELARPPLVDLRVEMDDRQPCGPRPCVWSWIERSRIEPLAEVAARKETPDA